MNDYGIFFMNRRDYNTQIIRAETAGKAKYLLYLRYSDVYDVTFGEFLKQVRCFKCSDSTESA